MADGEEETVGGEHEGWWHRHALTAFILLLAAGISFLIRVLYAYPLIATCDISYCFAGGSDSFYHARVATWIITNHTNLIHDPLLNYPLGSTNPREPLFDWMNAILGIILAPLFGGNAVTAGMWVLEMQPPFWAAVGVFPVYLLGKEVSSRRMGLLAALLYPLVVGNIESTVATYANYLPFYTFFVLLSAVTYIHSIKLAGTRRWVESYRSPRAIWAGVKEFARVEEHAVKWGVFTGVTLGATMLAWQGYTYVIALIIVFLAAISFVERVRRHDTFGAYLITLLAGTVGFAMAMPYYYVQGEFGYWFTVPMLLFFGGLLVLLPFLLMRDTPWVLSVPLLAGSVAAGAAALFLYSPSYFDAVLTGQGYFVKNLIFSTVAEAQAPSFDALIVSYGVATFALTFVGLALFIAYLYIYRFRREHVFMVIFGVLGIYLPISAAKFFLLGSPVFVLLPAECLIIALDRIGGYPQLRRNLSTLSDRGGGRFSALRRSIKARHLIVGVITILVVLPNVSWAVDSGIPYNIQAQYSQQIYASLPAELQTNAANASSFYLGIGGIDTDTPQQYDEAGYNWLSTQDTGVAPAQRPALISWWDYGFQTIDEAQHPVVADNFQEGIDPSGNFLLAQNESLAIATLAADLLVSEAEKTGNVYLPGDLDGDLRADGLNVSALHGYMVNTTQDIAIVLANPSFTNGYGTHDPANLDAANAEYDTISYLLASTLSENRVVDVYQTLQDYTGWSIRYAMADTRLFPTSGSNTGIYYAPVDLTDGVIGAGGLPTSYFTVTVTNADGSTYPLGENPAGEDEVSSAINYNSPFYNSMIYHIEVGYNGTQVGEGSGIPGLTLSSANPEPGWMEQHFMMVYRTAYWCPYTDYQAHPNCFVAVNTNTANFYNKAGIGTADTSASSYFDSGGETILAYYAGATVQGEVTLPGGAPDAGVRVTVNDEWGTPHMTTVTGANGQYTLIAPPGNDTVVASFGSVNPLTEEGSTLVKTMNLTVRSDQGYGDDIYPITENIPLRPGSVSGTVYYNEANSSSYQTSDPVVPGAKLTLSNGITTPTVATSDPSGVYLFPSVAPGSYNLTLKVGSFSTSEGTVSVGDASAVAQNEGLTVPRIHGMVLNETGKPVAGAVVTLSEVGGSSVSNITLTGGNYSFRPVAPGNYTVGAYYPGGQTSREYPVSISSFSTNLSLNISLVTPITLQFRALYEGTPVPGMLVRFTPLSGSNQSLVFVTGSGGWVTASVPAANWSVYAFGIVNGTYVAGIGDLHLSSTGLEAFLGGEDTITVTPAAELSGKVLLPTGAGQSGVELAVQNSQGALLTAISNTSGEYALFLPLGNYAVIANYSGSGGADSAFTGIALTQNAHLDIQLATSVAYNTQIGYETTAGTFIPLPGAHLNITQVESGATVQLAAGATGRLSAALPQTASPSSYDLTSKNYGFTTYTAGPETLGQLTSLYSRILLTVSEVPVHVVVFNSSLASSPPKVNFTALSANGVSVNVTGTNNTIDLYPGSYLVSAWAPTLGATHLQLFQNFTLSIPIGTTGVAVNVTLYGTLLYRINATTSGLPLSQVYAILTGPQGNFSLNGTALLRGFSAPSGLYNLWLAEKNGTLDYAYFDPETLYHNGTALPKDTPLVPAGSLEFSMVSPLGQAINASLFVRFSNGNGTTASFETGPLGNATLLLPRGGYNFTVDTTVVLYIGGVSQFWTIETNSSADTCAVNPYGLSTCRLVLLVTRAVTTLQGRVMINDQPAAGGVGTVTVTRLNATNASGAQTFPFTGGYLHFSLLPGYYVLYTLLGVGGVPYVNLTTLAVDYSSEAVAFSPTVLPGYTQTLDVVPARGAPSTPVVNLTVSVHGGANYTFSNFSVGRDQSVTLPSGVYTLTASADVETYGKTLVLSAVQDLTVSQSNSYLVLPLTARYVQSVTLTEVGSVTPVEDGQAVAIDFVVNNTGNEPLALHVEGSPSTWKIVLVPGNFTLGIAANNRSEAVDAIVTVPDGAAVSSPPVVFSVYLQGGSSSLGELSLTLPILPVYGMKLAASTSGNSQTATGETLFFTVAETGNAQEGATLTIGNAQDLTQDGWTYALQGTSGTPVTGPQTIEPNSAATSVSVVLTAKVPSPVIPAGVQIDAVDLSHPQSFATILLPFLSHANLLVNGTAIVTGPNVGGSPTPWWQAPLYEVLIFVPGIAILASVLTWRWWKTRKWVRS